MEEKGEEGGKKNMVFLWIIGGGRRNSRRHGRERWRNDIRWCGSFWLAVDITAFFLGNSYGSRLRKARSQSNSMG
jgi:hypothetical protein